MEAVTIAVAGRSCAVAWSGGKDSTLALHRARTRGYRVTHLFNIYEGSTGRVRFHDVRRPLIAAQAEALSLELVQEPTDADGFEPAFGRALDRLAEANVETLIFGNIHLEEIRAWYEERTRRRGFEHIEPLWGENPARLPMEFLVLGYRALVVSVMLEEGDPAWLGRELDADMIDEIAARPEADPSGETGEFHTFVREGPLFKRPVGLRRGEPMEKDGHLFLDLLPA